MEVFVRGSRSNAQEWASAQKIPLSEIPSLDENQRAAAKRENVSEESYARSAYAGHLSQQRLLRQTMRFGRWLNTKVEERNPGFHVDSVTLDTWEGRFQVVVLGNGELADFSIDEDLVERLMTTGSAELEKAIGRLLEINLPVQQVARAS